MEALRKELNNMMDDIDNCDRLKLLDISKKWIKLYVSILK